eukprot:2923143-Prymnesium_polylepis.1
MLVPSKTDQTNQQQHREHGERGSVKKRIAQEWARHTVEKKNQKSPSRKGTDELYASYLAIRALPVPVLLADDKNINVPLPVTSMGESRYLKMIGLSSVERSQIE